MSRKATPAGRRGGLLAGWPAGGLLRAACFSWLAGWLLKI